MLAFAQIYLTQRLMHLIRVTILEYLISWAMPIEIMNDCRERSGSVVECSTRDRRAAGSSLTGVTALWSLSKTHLS